MLSMTAAKKVRIQMHALVLTKSRQRQDHHLYFNGEGHSLNKEGQGQPFSERLELDLVSVASEGATPPKLPDEFFAAQAAGDSIKIAKILEEHTQKLNAIKEGVVGTTPEIRIARACLQYCYDKLKFSPDKPPMHVTMDDVFIEKVEDDKGNPVYFVQIVGR